MKIEKNFAVKASPEEVWAFLTDPHQVARCVPGAEITEQIDEQTHAGTITLKVGAIARVGEGIITSIGSTETHLRVMENPDSISRAVLERGLDETQVETVADLTVTGLLAQMGRGMIQDVSDQLFETFTEAVRAQLEGTAPAAGAAPAEGAASVTPARAEPVQVISLGTKVLGRATARAARRPGVWIAVVVVLVLLWLWLRG